MEEYLSTVKKWVIANPNEVITILFTNPDGVSIERWNSALVNTSIVDLAFVPPKTPMSRADWPTLGEMIDAGKRIVLFLDAGADQAKVPYLLDEFSQVSENPYNQLTTPFNCSLDRGTSPATSLWLDNHTKDIEVLKSGITIPDKDNLGLVNCVDGDTGVTRTARRCAAERGRTATFILVEYVDAFRLRYVGGSTARLTKVWHTVSTTCPVTKALCSLRRFSTDLNPIQVSAGLDVDLLAVCLTSTWLLPLLCQPIPQVRESIILIQPHSIVELAGSMILNSTRSYYCSCFSAATKCLQYNRISHNVNEAVR